MTIEKEYRISAIKDGTVIDHIPAEMTFKVFGLLDLSKIKGSISVASNLRSKRLGRKGIIKVGNKELTEKETNRIALFAPKASINIIKDYKVKAKRKVTLQPMLIGMVRCPNPNCITNKEAVETRCQVLNETPLELKCHHCERTMSQDDVVLL